MKKLVLLLMFVGLITLSACGNSSSSGSKDWPKGVSVASATIGGTFHAYATGWADVISEEMGIAVNVEATGGPIPNIKIVNKGDSPIGLVTTGPAYEAYNGIGWAKKKYQNVRSLFPMYKSYLHWFAMPDANIETVYDMEGKVVGTGAKGGTPDYYGRKVFQDLGIEPARIVNAGFSEYANLMRDGKMDAAGTFSPTGQPTAVEMVKTENANILGVGEKSEKLAKKYGISSGIIEANSYEGQTEDIKTLTIYSAYIVNKNLSDDFIYNLLKTTFDNKEELARIHEMFKELNLDTVPKALSKLPMHSGAIKYYEEMGVDLPESVYPPEYKK